MTYQSPTPDLPPDPLAAVTHPDPYPYYSKLLAAAPLGYDQSLKLWVAASADAVTAVLTHPASRVRPPGEPVPRPLAGSPAGDVFRQLVRMRDGERDHAHLKNAIVGALDEVVGRCQPVAGKWAERLAREIVDIDQPSGLTEFAYALPVTVIGELLGVADDDMAEVRAAVGQFVGCQSPACTQDLVRTGVTAATRLEHLVEMSGGRAGPDDTLVAALERHATREGGLDAALIRANAIGFLTQAYEATAGLIASTLLTLARRPELNTSQGTLATIVEEVLRFDSPVQNTRRWFARPARIGEHHLHAGDGVLVLLVAANRDPAANVSPDEFIPERSDRRLFTFGVGPHACPGRILATTIAEAGVAQLLIRGLDVSLIHLSPRGRRFVETLALR